MSTNFFITSGHTSSSSLVKVAFSGDGWVAATINWCNIRFGVSTSLSSSLPAASTSGCDGVCGNTTWWSYNFFSYFTQLSMKFTLLINDKMPTIVGILTIISRINTTFKSFQAEKIEFFQYFSFISSWNYKLSWAWKKFDNIGTYL